jgi:hypothetical protein
VWGLAAASLLLVGEVLGMFDIIHISKIFAAFEALTARIQEDVKDNCTEHDDCVLHEVDCKKVVKKEVGKIL